DDTSVLGFISNEFPLQFLGPATYFRPQAYVNAISGFDTQVGINALVNHPHFWAQGGYNSFYGPSFGLGVTLAKSIAIGGLLEFPTDDQLSDESTTFELVVSYFIGKQTFRKEVPSEVVLDPENAPVVDKIPSPVTIQNEEEPEEIEVKPPTKRKQRLLEKRRLDSIERAEKAAALKTMEKMRMDSINNARVKERREKEIKDSIALVKSREIALALNNKQEEVPEEIEPRPLSKRRQRRLEKRRLDSIEQSEKAAAIIRMEKRRMDSINTAKIKERREKEIKDSIAQVKSMEIASARERARLDSIAASELNKDVVLLPNERYEEVVKEEGLEPGFYLIANVFGTKKYYENFMKTLKGRGLSPGSFYRKVNGYNYVYLKRYNSIDVARKARDSNFDGKYQDKLWIFRIR
ncbi:MAG: type IX secretion system membrane protein PorP/SprF, partial [Bacteroidota bacterium]